MTWSRAAMRWAAIGCGLLLVVLVLEWRVLWLGAHPDMLIAIRPWSAADLGSALTGHWLFPAVTPYYRPLATLLFAADFELFGLNLPALHFMSLAWLALIATIMLHWLRREGDTLTAVCAVALYVTHPVLLDAAVAVPVYHIHLLATAIVALALSVWTTRCTSVSVRAWWPFFALAAAGFLVKEDTALLLPGLLVLQWMRARVFDDVQPPTRPLIASTVALLLTLVAIRWWFVPELDPTVTVDHSTTAALTSLVYAPVRSAFAMFLGGALRPVDTAFVLALQIAGAVAAWRSPKSTAGWLWLVGLVWLAVFSLPVSVVVPARSTRLHLTVFSAAVMLGAGASACLAWAWARGRVVAGIAAVALTIGIGLQWRTQAETMARRFTPCSDEQLQANDQIHWVAAAPDVLAWLARTPEICAARGWTSPDDDLDTIRWPHADGHTVVAHADATAVRLTFAASVPTVLDITTNGRATRVTVSADAPAVTLPLTASWRTWLRHGHRIDVRSGDATRVPDLIRAERP